MLQIQVNTPHEQPKKGGTVPPRWGFTPVTGRAGLAFQWVDPNEALEQRPPIFGIDLVARYGRENSAVRPPSMRIGQGAQVCARC